MPSSQTRIIVLGRLAIERDGAEPQADLPGRRSEVVFAYLATQHHRSVTRDELAAALWPGVLPDTWNAALRSVISDVRRFMERGGLDPAQTLRSEQGGLRFHFSPDMALDLDATKAALEHARERRAAGDLIEAARAAEQAAASSALPFLVAHDDHWIDDVRRDLDRIHIDALQLQAGALQAAGDLHGALEAADALVRADPYLEAAHRLRITLLGATGDRAGALKAFERCQKLLAAELGIAPSADTAEALRAALQASGDAAGPPSAAASRLAGVSVLVVEDHDFQRRTTLSLLRGLGVGQLHEASDGVAALALLDQGVTPHVIVCDIDMPGMDGVEFMRNVAERDLVAAVVFASGLDSRVLDTVRAASEGYGLQVLGAVSKPLTAAGLERLLGDLPPREPAPSTDPGGAASFTAIIDALGDGSLAASFEPIIDLALGRITGLRATLDAPVDGDLLAAADAAGLGRRLVEHLLHHVRDCSCDPPLDTFVGLAPSLLTDVSLVDGLAAITHERVVLVASADALSAASSPAMFDVIARLRVKGFGFCIDGSNTDLLTRLPLTHVQLPAALVARAARSGDAAALLPTVDASRRLGLPVVGGCANESEFELLLQAGCSFAHGPFLAQAVPAAEIRQLAHEWIVPPVAVDHMP